MTTLRAERLLVAPTFALLGLAFDPAAARSQQIVEFATPSSRVGVIRSSPGALYGSHLPDGVVRIALDGTQVEVAVGVPQCDPPSLAPPLKIDDLAVAGDGTLWTMSNCGLGFAGRTRSPGAVVARWTQDAGNLGRTLVAAFPTDVAAAQDGSLWLAGRDVDEPAQGAIWRVTQDLAISRFPIPGAGTTSGLAVGPDGNIWFTEGSARIGRLSPTGAVVQFDLPSPDRRPGFVTAGADGNLWFTESSADGSASWVGRATPAGVITEFPIFTSSPLGPARITAGPDGNVWFVEPGSPDAPLAAVGRVTPDGMITEFVTPTQQSGPFGIASASDGNVWFTEPSVRQIGRIDPRSGGCTTTPAALCLGKGRYRVESRWRGPQDSTPSAGHAVPLSTDTGYFWFFEPQNIEVIAKLLDGCSLNAQQWFFAGGLTDVEVSLTVTDTLTNAARTYTNPLGTAFLPVQDTRAFAACP